jgi:hypothetical protein
METYRSLKRLFTRPFMQEKENGVEPFGGQRDLASEVLTDAWRQLDLRLADSLMLPSEVATLVSSLALSNVASKMTPTEALKLATGKAMLDRLAAKVESYNTGQDGELVAFPSKR